MITNINYAGKVSIKVKGKPPVKVKNTGTSAFFQILYEVLAQTAIGEQQSLKLPSYMTLILKDDIVENLLTTKNDYAVVMSKSLLLSEMPVVERAASETGVSFSTVLTNSNIISSYSNSEEAYVLLLDAKREKILAYTMLDLSAIADVYNDTRGQATVTWSMTFTNTEEV